MTTWTGISFGLMIPFAVLAAIDGLYLHLWRLRLHKRPECRREHLLHTLRSIFFPVVLVLLFGSNRSGVLLWAGVAVVAADTLVELADMASERDSRLGIGGLGTFEYVLHGLLISIRSTSLALLFASKPAEAWRWSGAPALPPYGPVADAIVLLVLPGASVIAVLHVWLALHPPRGARPGGGNATGSQ